MLRQSPVAFDQYCENLSEAGCKRTKRFSGRNFKGESNIQAMT